MKFAQRMLKRSSSRRGFTLVEMMIVISLVVLLSSVAAVSNKAIGRQLVVTREHAKALVLFVRARSAGLTIPKAAPGELICAYGVHVEPATRTLTFFKDLGVFGSACDSSNQLYDGAAERLEQAVLGSDVVLTASGIQTILFMPPSGNVLIIAADGTPQESATVTITSAIAQVARGIKVNTFGQITEFEPAP